MRLRQVCLVAEKLEPTIETLASLLDAEICYRDPGIDFFGLENALLPVGTDFLEVVAPINEDSAASRHLARRGEGGYMLIMQCEDGLAARAHALAQGAQAVWQTDEKGIRATHFHPRSVPGAILSLDSMAETEPATGPGRRWDWAGPDWRAHLRDNGIRGLAGAVVEAAENADVAGRWSAVLGRPASDDASPQIDLEGGKLRFVPAASGDALFSEFSLEHAEPAAVLERARELGLETSDSVVRVAGVGVELRPPAAP